jgi:hypothetical protein
MGNSQSKIEEKEVIETKMIEKTTVLERLYKTVEELEKEIEVRFTLTHNKRIEKLKELIIFKEMIAIIEYLDDSMNVTNLNLK